MRGARVAVGVVAVLISLVVAAPAIGDAFCVNAPGCTGTPKSGIQQALDAAASTSGADTIQVGPGTYEGPFSDVFHSTVTLTGAGDETVLRDPTASTTNSRGSTLLIDEGTSSFSNFAVIVPPGDFGTAVQLSGTLDHVLVKDVASDTGDTGVAVFGSLSHSRIVLAGSSNGGTPPEGILDAGFLQDDLVHMLSPGARGIEASISAANAEGRQLTLVGPGDSATGPTDSASRGVSVDPLGVGAGPGSAITLDGVIISGFAHAMAADGTTGEDFFCTQNPPCFVPVPATINVTYSDFDPSNDVFGEIDDSHINTDSTDIRVDPGFKNPGAGNYLLKRGSLVIDKGDPAVPRAAGAGGPADSTIDLAGNPRRSDGDGDHKRIVDIGAFEYTDRPPVAVIRGPAHALAAQTVHFRGSASHDPDGDALKYLWKFGDLKRSTAVNPTHTYVRPGTYTVRLVVTDALGVRSAVVTKRIRITPPCVVPRLTGERLSGARGALTRAHCGLGKVTHQHSANVAQGRVIFSRPGAGSRLATGAPVALTLSSGR